MKICVDPREHVRERQEQEELHRSVRARQVELLFERVDRLGEVAVGEDAGLRRPVVPDV